MRTSTGDLDRNGSRRASQEGLWASLSVITRRWPLAAVGLAVTAAATLAALFLAPVSYSAKGTLLINLPPEATTSSSTQPPPTASSGSRQQQPRESTTTTVPAVNPILGTRGFIGDVLITLMLDPDAEARVEARGGTGTYKTSLSLGDASLVKVETTGDTPDEALRTWNATAEETSAALGRIQRDKGAPDMLLATADPLTKPAEAQKENGSRIRAVAATVVLGFGFTLALVYGTESMSRGRVPGSGQEGRAPGSGQGGRSSGSGPARRRGEASAYADTGVHTFGPGDVPPRVGPRSDLFATGGE
jgi:hypothetical protein